VFSMEIGSQLFLKSRKTDHYEKYAVAGTSYWVDTTHVKWTCPVSTRWILLGGSIYRSQSSTLTVAVYDSSDNIINYLSYKAAATGNTGFPDSTFTGNAIIIIDAGQYVQATFGTAQNTSAYASCVVIVIDV